jgi:hypothetical protein
MFSYSGSKLGANSNEALVLRKALHADDASLLASQVMRASETTDSDYVIELDEEGARQLRDTINRIENPSDALKNLRQLVS